MRALDIGTSIVGHDADWNMGFHQHLGFEISAVLEGSGKFAFGDEVHRIEAGHIVLIPSNLRHAYWAETPIRFAVNMVYPMPEQAYRLFRQLVPGDRPELIRLSPFDLEHYLSLFRVWMREVSGAPGAEEAYIAGWLQLFLLFLAEHTKPGQSTLSIGAAADYIRGHLQDELSLAEVAKSTGLSETAFRGLFKKTYGMTPKSYLHACRMAEAKLQLRATDKPLQQIAERIGFSGIHSFSAWFQRLEGLPPSEWRKRQQQT
ncbi:MAG: AraC family transcriptional regulator [Paenibacillaceae bacterium]|nr:AraC family transcriptional regulator [Paenibacillaceae bacterium]